MQNIKVGLIVLFFLLSLPLALAQESTDTRTVQDLIDRIEFTKVETLQQMKLIQSQQSNATQAMVEANFAHYDERMSDTIKTVKRDIAIIVVAGFIGAFVVSQIIRLQVERVRTRALANRGIQLQEKVTQLEHDARDLAQKLDEMVKVEAEFSSRIGYMRSSLEGGAARSAQSKNIYILIGVLVLVAAVCGLVYYLKYSGGLNG